MKQRDSLEDNIELYPKEMGWVSMDWINVTQGKDKWGGGSLVNIVMNHWFSRLAEDYMH